MTDSVTTIPVYFFGKLTDFTGSPRLDVPVANDTDELQQQLLQRFPLLGKATYVITVNRKVISQRTPLDAQAEVALLPPFSGG